MAVLGWLNRWALSLPHMLVVTAGVANLCSFVIVCSRTVEMQFPVAASHTADAQMIDFWFGLLF